jgi:hypothetical protein
VLLICDEEGLLGGTFFSLDGCKLSSNASKQWSGTISELNRRKEKIEKKVKKLLEEQVEEDKRDDDDERGGGPSGISNRKKQMERLQKTAERIEKFLKKNGPKIGKQGREIKSNVTDNESATMVSSHGNIQGYNAQALVDKKRQVILHAEAFGQAQDHHLVPPMLDGAKENMEGIGQGEDYFKGAIFTADSNYHDPTNLKKCEEEKLDAYIPDKRFRNRDPRFDNEKGKRHRRRVDRFNLNDFQHNEKDDDYLCPNGKLLNLQAKKAVVDGVIYRRYVADKNDCKGCELKVKCIRQKNAKRKIISIAVGRVPGNLTKAMAEKIDSEKGRKIYPQRIAIIEPVFGNIRNNKGMDRFTLRGKIKVNIQWMLYCMVHNIGKIVNYGFT